MRSSSSSGTIAAERLGRAALLALSALTACIPAAEEPGDVTPAAASGPTLRVLLAERVATVEVGSAGPITVTDRDGGALGTIPPGTPARLSATRGQLSLVAGPSRFTASFEIELAAPPPATVRVAGTAYRGRLRAAATTGGVQVVNVVGIEDYLGGVLGAEMGRRPPDEHEAVMAQAILSRTVAYRAIDRRRLQGWDLTATVADQVYRGLGGETPEGMAAVEQTRGTMVVWAGQPIDAFFHSTCGGRTATPDEVFAAAARPYLQSVQDLRGDGTAWCAASPRFRWREEWPAARLLAILRETLGGQGTDPTRFTALRDIAITARTPSGRVRSLRLDLGAAVVPLSGPGIRQALRTSEGQPLRSTAFDVSASRDANGVTAVAADGRGAGHGVGLCQWGAIGRARAGWDHRRILAAYFPGTELRRHW